MILVQVKMCSKIFTKFNRNYEVEMKGFKMYEHCNNCYQQKIYERKIPLSWQWASEVYDMIVFHGVKECEKANLHSKN